MARRDVQFELEATRRMIMNNCRMRELIVHFVAMVTKPHWAHLKHCD